MILPSAVICSNNTNKLSPQEPSATHFSLSYGSNNTNKLSPQEPSATHFSLSYGSNNTNKLSPQEHIFVPSTVAIVQIIQINLVLKNQVMLKIVYMGFK